MLDFADDGDTETSTADHTFVVKAQGAVTLKISSGISTDAGDLTTILELTNPTAEMGTDFFADDSQKSQVVTLQKNSPYYIKVFWDVFVPLSICEQGCPSCVEKCIPPYLIRGRGGE